MLRALYTPSSSCPRLLVLGSLSWHMFCSSFVSQFRCVSSRKSSWTVLITLFYLPICLLTSSLDCELLSSSPGLGLIPSPGCMYIVGVQQMCSDKSLPLKYPPHPFPPSFCGTVLSGGWVGQWLLRLGLRSGCQSWKPSITPSWLCDLGQGLYPSCISVSPFELGIEAALRKV